MTAYLTVDTLHCFDCFRRYNNEYRPLPVGHYQLFETSRPGRVASEFCDEYFNGGTLASISSHGEMENLMEKMATWTVDTREFWVDPGDTDYNYHATPYGEDLSCRCDLFPNLVPKQNVTFYLMSHCVLETIFTFTNYDI